MFSCVYEFFDQCFQGDLAIGSLPPHVAIHMYASRSTKCSHVYVNLIIIISRRPSYLVVTSSCRHSYVRLLLCWMYYLLCQRIHLYAVAGRVLTHLWIHISLYTCIYTSVYTSVYAYIYICIQTSLHISSMIHLYIRKPLTHMYIHIAHVYIHLSCIYTSLRYIHISECAHLCTLVYTHLYTHLYLHIYIYIHTHISTHFIYDTSLYIHISHTRV